MCLCTQLPFLELFISWCDHCLQFPSVWRIPLNISYLVMTSFTFCRSESILFLHFRKTVFCCIKVSRLAVFSFPDLASVPSPVVADEKADGAPDFVPLSVTNLPLAVFRILPPSLSKLGCVSVVFFMSLSLVFMCVQNFIKCGKFLVTMSILFC